MKLALLCHGKEINAKGYCKIDISGMVVHGADGITTNTAVIEFAAAKEKWPVVTHGAVMDESDNVIAIREFVVPRTVDFDEWLIIKPFQLRFSVS